MTAIAAVGLEALAASMQWQQADSGSDNAARATLLWLRDAWSL